MSDTNRSDMQAALDELAATANRIADERNELLAAAKLARQALSTGAANAALNFLDAAIERAEGRS